MKRRITALMMAAAMCMSLVACGGSNSSTGAADTKAADSNSADSNTAESGSAAVDASDLKIGLVTDVGGVNDGSFNQTA